MKNMILNGSPRQDGDTAALLTEMKKHLAGEITEFSAYHDDISPCIDCRYCWSHEGCAVQDGMQAVYHAVEESDNIIIASPLHYSRLTGPLLSLAGRFQRYYAAKRFLKSPVTIKRKNGVLVLVGGGDGNEKPAQDTANILFRQMNAECIGTALSLHTDTMPPALDAVAMAKVKELALALNELYKCSNC